MKRTFYRAAAIFANNDLKYEANKLRAQQYAAKGCLAITYCPAKDTPSIDALRERVTHSSTSLLNLAY